MTRCDIQACNGDHEPGHPHVTPEPSAEADKRAALHRKYLAATTDDDRDRIWQDILRNDRRTPAPSAEADAAHCEGCLTLSGPYPCPGLSRPATPPLDVDPIRLANAYWLTGHYGNSTDFWEAVAAKYAALAIPTPEPSAYETYTANDGEVSIRRKSEPSAEADAGLDDLTITTEAGTLMLDHFFKEEGPERIDAEACIRAIESQAMNRAGPLRDAARRVLREADRDTDAFRDLRAALANPTPEQEVSS
jgi:hypothetical protein